MTVDKPPMRLEWRPTAVVDSNEEMTEFLDSLAKAWPEYQPVVHRRYGTYGVVKDDSPANVPHLFDGKPRRVCIDADGHTWVSVVWNPGGPFPLRCWAPAHLLETCGRRW